jgi:hypothetical protein
LIFRMTLIISSYFIKVLGDKDVDLEMPKFLGNLEKVGKIFFQSIGAKKSKIVNKISSKLEGLKGDRVKLVLVVK